MKAPIPSNHPNATAALATGSGLGSLVAWLLNDVGHLAVPAVGCAAIAGGIAAVALFIGRNGIRGVAQLIWRGNRTA